MGYIPKYIKRYASLEDAGFTIVFKDTVIGANRQIKGNCDTDLVLRVARDTYEDDYDEAIIVSSDGDFVSLVDFLAKRKRLKVVLSPHNTCSLLIKKLNPPITYLKDIRTLVEKQA